MATVTDAGDAAGHAARVRPQPLEIAVPTGNPGRVTTA